MPITFVIISWASKLNLMRERGGIIRIAIIQIDESARKKRDKLVFAEKRKSDGC